MWNIHAEYYKYSLTCIYFDINAWYTISTEYGDLDNNKKKLGDKKIYDKNI